MSTEQSSNSKPSEVFNAGMRTRRAVMGDQFVDRALARATGTESADLQQFVTEHVWGGLWTRPGLTHRDRSLLNIGILSALRAHEELAGHVRGALTNGLSRAEITEAVIHVSGYCGAPAALAAMKVVQQVFDAESSDNGSDASSGRTGEADSART